MDYACGQEVRPPLISAADFMSGIGRDLIARFLQIFPISICLVV